MTDKKGTYIGESLPILRVFEEIKRLNLDHNAPILILGETGVGKTEIADLIHVHSGRKGECRHESAVTGYNADAGLWRGHWIGYGKQSGLHNIEAGGHPGVLQKYKGGTIFLDECGDMTPEFQTFLLAVLDQKPMSLTSGVGDQVKPDVRMIFATNRDLTKLVEAESFRHDLYDRLRTRMITIPPLRATARTFFCSYRI